MGKISLIGLKYCYISKNRACWTECTYNKVLEKGARQGDPNYAYLFILALEILSSLNKNDSSRKGIKVFDYVFLYTAYADDSTFFLKDLASVKKLLDIFAYYLKYSGLKPNFSKCEIAEIGSLKGVEVIVCGIKCVNVKVNTIKVLGIHFSYYNKLNMEKNFLAAISNIQSVLKIRSMKNLTLEGKIIVFKTLALSKVVRIGFTSVVPKQIVEEIKSTPKINHSPLCNSFATGGLTNTDINTKIASLQCSLIKRLYDDSFHEWKLIPLHLINTTITPAFKFHPSLALSFQLDEFPKFYQNIFQFWSTCFRSASIVPSITLFELLWFNRNIKVDNRPVLFKHFSEKGVNFVSCIMKENGEIKS